MVVGLLGNLDEMTTPGFVGWLTEMFQTEMCDLLDVDRFLKPFESAVWDCTDRYREDADDLDD